MKLTNLQGAELINVLKSTMGSLWLITLESQEVEILQNVMIPELTGRVMDYKELIAIYLQEYVYPSDKEKWQACMSLSALKRDVSVCVQGKRSLRCGFGINLFGFEWHQAFLHVFEDESGKPDRILLSSRYINEFKRGEIIAKAVETEYDYVNYIDADTNSYVMYASNVQSGNTDASDHE